VIPDEVVEQVRDTADIVQVISEYVNLKRVGTDFRGPCPFHQGTHRNFSVSPKKRMYYCFVCHEGGDVFHFLQKRLGVEWPGSDGAILGLLVLYVLTATIYITIERRRAFGFRPAA